MSHSEKFNEEQHNNEETVQTPDWHVQCEQATPSTPSTPAANTVNLAQEITRLMRVVPDFPKAGVSFLDLTTVILDHGVFAQIIDWLATIGEKYDYVAGIDARGFIFAAAVAYKENIGMLAIRKKGKLPPPVLTQEYYLEYGTAELAIPEDLTQLRNKKVLIVDDVLATGGSAKAAWELLQQCEAEVVGLAVVVEIEGLAGRKVFPGPIYAIMKS